MGQRVLTDWISAYLKYTENTEPSTNYHLWCAISALAGGIERKVYLQWGKQQIYANFYIVLVGDAGWARKGTAIDHIRPIIEESGVKTMSGAITMEKLSRRLNDAVTTFEDPTDGMIKPHCSITFISPELQVFLREKNVDLLARLTDLYDCPDPWIYDTKNSGTDYVRGSFFNLLAATAPDWIKSMLPDPAVGGGFTRRIIWVVEEDKRTQPFPEVDLDLEAKLINDLQLINRNMRGGILFTPEAKEIYKDWYIAQDEAYRKGDLAILDPRFAGYCATRAAILRKLSIICSVSESSGMLITPEHFERAKKLLEQTEKKMPRAFHALGQARYAHAIEQIFSFIVHRGKAERKEILRFMYRDIDEATYNIAILTLQRMEAIDVTKDGKKEIIELKDNACNILKPDL